MSCSFPNLNWARQTINEDQSAEIFDCDGKYHQFEDIGSSDLWLQEDEYILLEELDWEDEKDLGTDQGNIQTPIAKGDVELAKIMYVKRTLRL